MHKIFAFAALMIVAAAFAVPTAYFSAPQPQLPKAKTHVVIEISFGGKSFTVEGDVDRADWEKVARN